MPNIPRLQIFSSETVVFTMKLSHDLNLGYKIWFISSEWLLARVSKFKQNRHASYTKPGLYFNTCAAVWRVRHSHEGRDYNQGWACLSLAVWARWRQGWVWDSVTYKVDPMLAAGRESTSRSCESPVATAYRPAWIHSAIYQSHQREPAGRCAACYLTWLSGSSSAHCRTQTHSPVMIHCLSAYGITLEPSGQTAARCFMEENSDERAPDWSSWVAAARQTDQMFGLFGSFVYFWFLLFFILKTLLSEVQMNCCLFCYIPLKHKVCFMTVLGLTRMSRCWLFFSVSNRKLL